MSKWTVHVPDGSGPAPCHVEPGWQPARHYRHHTRHYVEAATENEAIAKARRGEAQRRHERERSR